MTSLQAAASNVQAEWGHEELDLRRSDSIQAETIAIKPYAINTHGTRALDPYNRPSFILDLDDHFAAIALVLPSLDHVLKTTGADLLILLSLDHTAGKQPLDDWIVLYCGLVDRLGSLGILSRRPRWISYVFPPSKSGIPLQSLVVAKSFVLADDCLKTSLAILGSSEEVAS